MADEEPDERPDIFYNQRERSRKKYASSDEEDESDEDHPPNPPGGPPKPPTDGDGDDSDNGPRGDGRPGTKGGTSGREQNDSDQAGSSATLGSLNPAVHGKRKAEDQNDIQNDNSESKDDTDASTNMPRSTEAETTITTTPETSNIAPSTLSGEQSEEDDTDNRTGKLPAASKLPFSFANPKTQTLAAEIHIMLLLGKCQAALRNHRTKDDLGSYECKLLKHAALHAYSVAKGVEDSVAEETMARCCVYIALTEALYSADSARKSDQRALEWFRQTFRYRGTAEADLAQLWIKELEAHERARNAVHRHTLPDNSGSEAQDRSITLPASPESPLRHTRRWLIEQLIGR